MTSPDAALEPGEARLNAEGLAAAAVVAAVDLSLPEISPSSASVLWAR
jgi:hypothetical protein